MARRQKPYDSELIKVFDLSLPLFIYIYIYIYDCIGEKLTITKYQVPSPIESVNALLTHTHTHARAHTHTHIHTHKYIYIYILNNSPNGKKKKTRQVI